MFTMAKNFLNGQVLNGQDIEGKSVRNQPPILDVWNQLRQVKLYEISYSYDLYLVI